VVLTFEGVHLSNLSCFVNLILVQILMSKILNVIHVTIIIYLNDLFKRYLINFNYF